jgi:ribosome biogenesis protein SSF1/2
MTLKLRQWSLIRDVVSSQARPRLPPNAFKSPPLVLLSGFDSREHLKLATVSG